MRFVSIIFAFILCLSIIAGCKTFEKMGIKLKLPDSKTRPMGQKGKGPPPHAPAHGYRHRNQHGLELQFDSGRGVYVVIESPNVYFYNDLYIRSSDGHWEVAANFNGPWRSETSGEVPTKLKVSKGKGYGASKGKGKGYGKGRSK
jgi:hypothetical protein